MDVLGITEHAARQSDRWMFVACLVIMLAGILMLWRWFTNDRADVARRLTEITDRHIEAGQHLSQVVTNNTEALRRVEAAVSGCRDLQQLRWRQENPAIYPPGFPPEKRP
jgi:hypothetical protein